MQESPSQKLLRFAFRVVGRISVLYNCIRRISLWQLAVLCAGIVVHSSNGLAEILVIATGELPPYVSRNPKDSFLTAVLTEVGHEMGVTFEFRFMPWKRCEAAVEGLEAWGAVPYVPTPERKVKFHFSDKLFNRQMRFYRYVSNGEKKEIPYSELRDLKEYVIGAVRGYYYEHWLRDAGLRVEYVTEDGRNFVKLRKGKVDLILSDEAVAAHIIRNEFPTDAQKFVALSKPLDASGDYLITSKNYPKTQYFLGKFNISLAKIKSNGTYQRILDKYRVEITY